MNKDVFADVRNFLANEEQWNNAKGIPFQRGWLLHGPPGTGKTSIIKALANESVATYVIILRNGN